MTIIKSYNTDKRKTWHIVCHGKEISKHESLWHAQNYILKLFRENKIDNSYEILPIKK